MKPVSFPGQTKIYTAPENWDAATMGECRDLPVRQVGGKITSCYELDDLEIHKLYGGAKLYFTIYVEVQPVVSWEIK